MKRKRNSGFTAELQGQGPHHNNVSLTVQAADDEDKCIDEQDGINVAEEVVYLDLVMDVLNAGAPPPKKKINTWSGA